MADYINRDEALFELRTGLFPQDVEYTEAVSIAESIIKGAPGVDAVEVVRCKDCVNWGGVTYGFICRKFSGVDTKICMGADHYCSYGVRRENDVHTDTEF